MILKRNRKIKISEIDVLGIKYFYKLFPQKKRRYPPSLFCVGTEVKAKRWQPVSYTLFRAIVKEYLRVYFFDLYSGTKTLYFPIGGLLKKVAYESWFNLQRKGNSDRKGTGSDKAIGLFWYMRPSPKMFKMVTLKKLTGSSNQLPRIEKFFVQNYNKDILPIFIPALKEANENKTLYVCTLTS